MAISKLILNNVVQMDLTDSTVTNASVIDGNVAYNATGQKIIGVAQGGVVSQDASGAVVFAEGNETDHHAAGSIYGFGYIPNDITVKVTTRDVPIKDVVFNFPYATFDCSGLFNGTAMPIGGPVKLIINCKNTPSSTSGTSMNTLCFRTQAIREVVFNCTEADYVALGTDCFEGASGTACSVISVAATGTPLSIKSYATGSYRMFEGNKVIQEIRFYENFSSTAIDFTNVLSISDATLVSIANALQVPESTATLTLHSTPKGRLSTIMGNVVSVTRGEETYSRFVPDVNGTTTLQYFITTTKGWTLA